MIISHVYEFVQYVPVEFTDSPQPADVAPAAGQDGQVVGVQCQEETLCGEFGFRELGGVFICAYEQIKFIICNKQHHQSARTFICQFDYLDKVKLVCHAILGHVLKVFNNYFICNMNCIYLFSSCRWLIVNTRGKINTVTQGINDLWLVGSRVEKKKKSH